ncbi:hypothetical protein [Myroides sp. TSA_177.3]|uniref:hypothetical protein n=1 Tax=Myroides sp. TSA_177.3 TaxID=3415650 RepID=UPI0040457EA8
MKQYYYYLTILILFSTYCASWGQIPPYQYSNIDFPYTQWLYRRADNLYGMREIFPKYFVLPPSKKVSFYEREEIPFYSVFNYSDMDQFELEKNLQIFNYRNYNSFKAPKGVKKITYHLYNNLIDSANYVKHEFFFDKKSRFVEREVRYGEEMYSTINWNFIEMEEYQYRYNEDERYLVVEKLMQANDSLISLAKYSYTKDKKLLAKVEFLSKEFNWNSLRGKLLKVPIKNKVEYCYDQDNRIFDILLNGISLKQNIPIYKNTIDAQVANTWLNENYWKSFLELNEDRSKTVRFASNLDPDVIKKDFYTLETNSAVSTDEVEKLNIVVQSYKSDNVFKNSYSEKHFTGQENNEKCDNFSSSYLLLTNEKHKISNAYFSSKYSIETVPYKHSMALINKQTKTVSRFIFIFKNKDYNSYLIKRIDKKNLDSIDLFRYMNDKNVNIDLLQYNRSPDFKNELFTLKLKSKRGLNEVYLVKGEKVYPLITIN